MTDPTLHVLAWFVLCVDLAMLAGALVLSYVLIRYRRGITLWYAYVKQLNE